jgi:hypothetical protein
MKVFILKIIFFLLPLIIIFFIMESLIRDIPNDYNYKKEYLNNNSQDITTLFLGNSHAYYGINPVYITGNAFNASHISQSLNLDYEIFKKYKDDWDELKFIIISVDYISLFGRLSKGIEKWRIKNYNLYYDMHLSNSLSNNSELLSINFQFNIMRIYSYYIQNITPISCSKLGYADIFTKRLDLKEKNLLLEKTGKSAALRHTKSDFSLMNENLQILEEMIHFASKNNIEIIIYTPPAYKTYVSNLNKNQLSTVINALTALAENNANCIYINLLEDTRFSSDDYRDADHLNPNGAKKLSLIFNKIISNKTKSEQTMRAIN